MEIAKKFHLTYCTNIHPGESWVDVKLSLEKYLLDVKAQISPNQPFGVGLRLSNHAANELLQGDQLFMFKRWLSKQGLYVFTLNGFPFGNFHGTVVKDGVHKPDWTTSERVDYTKNLFTILSDLVPDGIDGGISTSPLSYKYWTPAGIERSKVVRKSTERVLEVVDYLLGLRAEKGQILHLDIEPEPDGILENTQEVIDYFHDWLIPMGKEFFKDRLAEQEIETTLKDHVRLCYDVCHFAVEYEDSASALGRFEAQGIRIGKIQISAALRAFLSEDVAQRESVTREFEAFNESTYLHQVIERDQNGKLTNYADLPQALAQINKMEAREWRSHFHVPIFVRKYGNLLSTRDEIRKTLEYVQSHPVTDQLEVETYTWEVLPQGLRKGLTLSIGRELQWVIDELKAQ